MGTLEAVECGVSCSPERPLQTAFWIHPGTYGAQPTKGSLELRCPGSPSLEEHQGPRTLHLPTIHRNPPGLLRS